MDQRSTFLIEILEKLGAPLMAAIQAVAEGRQGDAAPAQDAKTMAELLAKTVQVSITMAGTMDLKDEDGDADAIRLALAALAGPLIASAYRNHGKVPQDADITRINKSLEAVLAFSNNFTPSAEYVGRLKGFDGVTPFYDATQSHLYTINALVPAINAIAEFPFGQPENKLVQEVAGRLGQQAEAIRKELVGDVAEAEAKFAELMILRSLAEIYTECHRAETTRLSASENEARPEGLSLDPVWEAFETRAAMLTTVVNMAVPGAPEAPSQSAAAPAPSETAPASAPQETAAPAASSGPMGFFAKKDPPAPVDSPAAPPADPASSAPLSAPVSPAETPAAPPSDGNPMTFFKPGAKTPGDNAGEQTGDENQ